MERSNQAPTKKTGAVIPFRNLTGDPQKMFSVILSKAKNLILSVIQNPSPRVTLSEAKGLGFRLRANSVKDLGKFFRLAQDKLRFTVQNDMAGQALQQDFQGKRQTMFRTTGGFTLLEFLLTVAIFSFIVGIVGEAFRFSIRCWEKGEKEVEEFREVRVVLDKIAQQLKSIYPYWVKNGEEWRILFEGDPASLKFVSPVSIKSPVITGLQLVHYVIENDRNSAKGKTLLVRESRVISDDSLGESSQGMNEKGSDVLLSGLEDVAFDFYDFPPDAKEGTWQESWYGGDIEDPKLPQAIRITLRQAPKNAEETEPITTAMTIPLMATPDKEILALNRGTVPLTSLPGVQGSTQFGPPFPPDSPSVFPSQGRDSNRPSFSSNPFGGDSRIFPGNRGNPNRSPSTPFGPLPAPPGGSGRDGRQSTPFDQ